MTLIDVVAAVIERDRRLLLCQRAAHKRHGSLWEFPGGKVETGESYFQAAARELAEELGVVVTSVGEPELALSDGGSNFRIVFMPVAIQGEPQRIEHQASRGFEIAGQTGGFF